MKTEYKIVTKMIAKWTQQETKTNLNLSSTQFSETHLPQARSGLLPQAIEIRSGPEAPGRDGAPGKVALVFVWFSFCGSSFVGGLLLKRSLVARDFAYIFGLRKRTFFKRFFKLVLGRFFIGFGGLLGAHVGSFFNVFSMKKSTTFWDRFSEAFGRVSGTPDPPKLSSRVYETLIFEFQHVLLIFFKISKNSVSCIRNTNF